MDKYQYFLLAYKGPIRFLGVIGRLFLYLFVSDSTDFLRELLNSVNLRALGDFIVLIFLVTEGVLE